jgi:hypothetical protein
MYAKKEWVAKKRKIHTKEREGKLESIKRVKSAIFFLPFWLKFLSGTERIVSISPCLP